MSASSPKMQQRGDVKVITLSGGKVRVMEDLMEGELEGLTEEPGGVISCSTSAKSSISTATIWVCLSTSIRG